MGFSKVVSTHLWNTPLNLDSFHSWPSGLPVVVIFLEFSHSYHV